MVSPLLSSQGKQARHIQEGIGLEELQRAPQGSRTYNWGDKHTQYRFSTDRRRGWSVRRIPYAHQHRRSHRLEKASISGRFTLLRQRESSEGLILRPSELLLRFLAELSQSLLCDLKLKGRIEVSRIEWIRGNPLRLILMLSIIFFFFRPYGGGFPPLFFLYYIRKGALLH